uniref:Uncharacterized protein n=1 Tax=Florenciella parvula TaxID=236787 RepID=A0A7S2BWQ9_9STRA|mmetsp:Transcript_21335/g.44490  ORF Transcript_21335/g.44490 Transcript_21335/m.44490 type:complete len:119 (+) Transcript_21335:62-418(+)
MLRLVLLAFTIAAASANFYICESGSEQFLGHYTMDTSKTDGAPKFSNDEGMSVYRHSGYWYIGDLGPWPPETHYRCIQGCEHGMDSPQLDKVYEQNRNIGQLPAPTLQADPCAVNDEL